MVNLNQDMGVGCHMMNLAQTIKQLLMSYGVLINGSNRNSIMFQKQDGIFILKGFLQQMQHFFTILDSTHCFFPILIMMNSKKENKINQHYFYGDLKKIINKNKF